MQKKNSLWDERRGSSKLSYNRMPKKQNKTTSEKKRPTKTVLDGKESGDTSFATLTKVAAGSGKRKQQDGSNSFTGPWLRGSLTKQRMLEVSRYCWMNSKVFFLFAFLLVVFGFIIHKSNKKAQFSQADQHFWCLVSYLLHLPVLLSGGSEHKQHGEVMESQSYLV